MTTIENMNAEEFYVSTYDQSLADWEGELDFYKTMAVKVKSRHGSVLEVACGTGRVAIRLADDGVAVVGLDFSSQMLERANQKSIGIKNISWVEADMRAFRLEQSFDLVLIPGHSFQNLNTSQDQVNCLDCIKDHLNPDGKLVIHIDNMSRENMTWIGNLCQQGNPVFEAGQVFQHPTTKQRVRPLEAWSYSPSTQSAVLQTVWEILGENGHVIKRIERKPVQLHCIFPSEMEHLLARVGFSIEDVYGDFFRNPLNDTSEHMLWIAHKYDE